MTPPTRRPDTERTQERRRRGAHEAAGDRRGLEGRTPGSPDHDPEARPFKGRPYLLGALHPDTAEMVELCETLGLVHLADVVQVRDRPRPGTFFGSGKVVALRYWIRELEEGRIPDDWLAEGDHWVALGEPEDPGESRADAVVSDGDGAVRPGEDGHEDEGRHDAWAALRDDPSVEVSAPGHRPRRQARRKAEHEARKGEADARTGASEVRAGGGADDGDPFVSTGTGRPSGVAGRREADEGTVYRAAHPATPPHELVPPAYDPSSDPELLLVLDEDVKPSVLFNLEDRLGIEVWDRTRLILEIFGAHAHVKEAKLQVELAKLQYEIPLMREAIHRKRSGERPGFMGGGEYDVADYQEFIKRRMRTVKEELERIRRERGVRRQVRREGFYLVSLAGYTNAGKSTLLNTLTGADVQSEWTMFSTLATTTRRLVDPRPAASSAEIARAEPTGMRRARPSTAPSASLRDEAQADTNMSSSMGDPSVSSGRSSMDGDGSGAEHVGAPTPRSPSQTMPENRYQRPVLVTDTVGFIQGLPSWLLEAFHSTLEEIGVSDVVLLVADVSDPIETMVEKVRVCKEELSFLDVTCPVLVVLNKVDLIPEGVWETRKRAIVAKGLADEADILTVSCADGTGLADLRDRIDAALPSYVRYRITLPYDDAGQRILSRLFAWGWVHDVSYEDQMEAEGSCDRLHWQEMLKETQEAGFTIERI